MPLPTSGNGDHEAGAVEVFEVDAELLIEEVAVVEVESEPEAVTSPCHRRCPQKQIVPDF